MSVGGQETLSAQFCLLTINPTALWVLLLVDLEPLRANHKVKIERKRKLWLAEAEEVLLVSARTLLALEKSHDVPGQTHSLRVTSQRLSL